MNNRNRNYINFSFSFFVFLLFPFFAFSKESENEGLTLIVEEIQNILHDRGNTGLTNAPPIISIAGCPGVGKTTIAKLLQVELDEVGITSVIINFDHYGRSQEERKQYTNEFDLRRFHWDKIHHTLTMIREGNIEIIKPTINQLTKEMGVETLYLENVECILFEGMYVLCDFPPMNLLEYADLAIYLETSLENIYDWKWERELKKAVPRTSKEFSLHMQAMLENFVLCVYPARKNADYITQIDSSHRYSVIHADGIKKKPTPDFTLLRQSIPAEKLTAYE